jgi:16S rRNA (cytidine1402-2'-O)-methyltransferase
LITVNDHTEARQVRALLARVEGGERVAVVTDAGTPGISDPGERLVAAAGAAGLDVEVVPGASAAIAALVVSGLPTGRFVFEGFLPRSGSGRTERLDALRNEQRTAILYEAPHRVRRTVAQLAEAFGPERRLVIVRELTKLHEEVWRGTLAGAVARLAEKEPRGEYVLILGGAAPPAEPSADDVTRALRSRMAAGDDKKTATAEVAKELRVSKRTVYEIATRL